MNSEWANQVNEERKKSEKTLVLVPVQPLLDCRKVTSPNPDQELTPTEQSPCLLFSHCLAPESHGKFEMLYSFFVLMEGF